MMSEEKEPVLFSAPPRLMLGVAFLFWGAMHDLPLVSLFAAILMEGRHWTGLRWRFGEMGFARSWQLSVIILIVSALGLLQIEERETADFLGLLSWLPFIMMPLALAQQYASDPGTPVTTFSFIARRKMAADRKAGREVRLSYVQLGYPYFFLVLIVAGMGVGGFVDSEGGGIRFAVGVRYSVGVALLLGWAMFAMHRRNDRKGAWGWAYFGAVAMSLLMAWGVIVAYQFFLKTGTRSTRSSQSSFESHTSMGQVKTLQFSPKIIWRYKHEEGPRPDLLKISSFNDSNGDMWAVDGRRQSLRETIPKGRRVGGYFQAFLKEGEEDFFYTEEDKSREFAIRGTIEGMVSDQSLIPHLSRTRRYEQVPTEILSVNPMGAVQINAPRQGAMRIGLFSDPELAQLEHDPSRRDIVVPGRERIGVEGHLLSLELVPPAFVEAEKKEGVKGRGALVWPKPREVTREEFEEIRGRIARSFLADFKYSLLLSGKNLQQPVTEFLQTTKKGHCEYFASATALLLRRMEIPTRYVVGFAVQEEGKNGEFLLRGRHAHAWAQAYVGGTWVNEGSEDDSIWRCRGGEWVDVDLTPPDWFGKNEEMSWMQGFYDWWQKARTDVAIWMADPGVSRGFKIGLGILGGGLLLYLIWTLVRNRGREGRGRAGSWEEKVRTQGLLRDFERWLARKVGPRPTAQPMAVWLREHLPPESAGLVESYERATFHPEGVAPERLDGQIKEAKVIWKQAQAK